MSVDSGGQAEVVARDGEALPELVRIVRRRLPVAAAAFILSVAAAAAAAWVAPPVYEASSTVIADRSPPVVLLGNAGQESNLLQWQVSDAPDVATFTEIVKSQAVRDEAAARLARLVGAADARAALGRVTVQQVRNTEIVRITAAARDPAAAARTANAMAQSVIALDLQARRRLVANARKFIADQLETAGQNLQMRENLVTDFKNRNRDVSLSDQTALALRKLADLEARLDDVRLQQEEAQSGVVPAPGPTGAGGAAGAAADPAVRVVSPPGAPESPLVAALQAQLASLQVEMSGLRKQFTPLHPQVISTQAKIDETQRALNAAIARNRAGLQARAQGLSADIGEVERSLMQIPSREATLARLTRDANEAQRTYMLLSAQLQNARIVEGSIGSSVRVLDAARPASRPARPKRALDLILGAVVGMLLGVTAAYAVEQCDTMVRSPEEAASLGGAPLLGVIPPWPAGTVAAGRPVAVLTPSGEASGAGEAFRGLRTRLLGAMRGRQDKCFLITSALPGEGKTTVAANLAAALARADRSVCLVEGDLRRPALHAVFPEAASAGVAGVLAGRAAMADAVRPTAQPRLACLVSGGAVPNPAALLDTEAWAGLVQAARGLADVVVIDSPALLPTADAEVLGVQADAAVLVVRAGRTDRSALVQARERCEQAGIRVVGIVLNAARTPAAR